MNKINGILLLYVYPSLSKNANTIMEHVQAFEKYSTYKVFPINTELGFPDQILSDFSFSIILVHYSIFRAGSVYDSLKNYLKMNKDSYIIAFFQDEHHFCGERFDLINGCNIDCIYTLIEPQYFPVTYRKYTHVTKIIYCLPGYVCDELIDAAKKYSLPDEARSIDIGYRGRPLLYYMGKGSQEKKEIAEKFLENVDQSSWKLDIKTGENDRIYGKKWFKFLGNCKGMLGVEAGVSVFDIEDTVYKKYQQLMKISEYHEMISQKHEYSFDEVSEKLQLSNYEDNIYYRTISPRHFEAAAFRICQILYEGKYSGIMKPWVHYLPLKKDFSNFEEITRCFSDPSIRRAIVENAHRDMIRSQEYSYKKFIQDFDRNLFEDGFKSDIDKKRTREIYSVFRRYSRRAIIKQITYLCIVGIFAHLPQSCKTGIRRMYMFFFRGK